MTSGGVLGLAPNATIGRDLFAEFNLGNRPQFAMHLSETAESFIEYGPPQSTEHSGKITWLANLANDKNKWGNKIRGVRIGGVEQFTDIDFAFDEADATLYSGGQCMYGPAEQVEWLRAVLSDALVYYIYDEGYSFKYQFLCVKNMPQLPSIWLLLGEHWMEVKPEQYTMPVSGDKCSFCFVP